MKFKKKSKKYPIIVIMNLVYDILNDPAHYANTEELYNRTTEQYVKEKLEDIEGFYSKEELNYETSKPQGEEQG